MRLQYADAGNGLEPLVLQRDKHRVELHVRPCDALWMLIGLAGQADQPAETCKCQGPYQSRAQAVAATRAILAALQSRSYEIVDRPACWTVQAQAQMRRGVEERNRFTVDTHFNPDTDLY